MAIFAHISLFTDLAFNHSDHLRCKKYALHSTADVQAFRQTIGAFVYHDVRKSNDVVIILVQGRWSHRPPLTYPETEQ